MLEMLANERVLENLSIRVLVLERGQIELGLKDVAILNLLIKGGRRVTRRVNVVDPVFNAFKKVSLFSVGHSVQSIEAVAHVAQIVPSLHIDALDLFNSFLVKQGANMLFHLRSQVFVSLDFVKTLFDLSVIVRADLPVPSRLKSQLFCIEHGLVYLDRLHADKSSLPRESFYDLRSAPRVVRMNV